MIAKLIFYYILSAIRLRVPPWYYFQINVEYYNARKWIYSKNDIFRLIPKPWQLKQQVLDKRRIPKKFPIFLKPEWGQNGKGITLVRSKAQYLALCDKLQGKTQRYLVQSVAKEPKEFEIFYILDAHNRTDYVALTITEVLNDNERYPINSVNNQNTLYQDCTERFSREDIAQIKSHLQRLPAFRIARIGLKANSAAALVAGDFKIIEINLFTPMPLNLLDAQISNAQKSEFIKRSMFYLAEITSSVPKEYFQRFIFFKQVIRHYQVK